MAKLSQALTLENIGKLIDQKLAGNNVAIFGAIDLPAARLEEKLGLRIEAVEQDLGSLKKEMHQRFDEVDDKLQSKT